MYSFQVHMVCIELPLTKKNRMSITKHGHCSTPDFRTFPKMPCIQQTSFWNGKPDTVFAPQVFTYPSPFGHNLCLSPWRKEHVVLLRIDTVSDAGYCFSVNGAFRQRNLEESLEISDAGAGGKDLGVDSTKCLRCPIRWGLIYRDLVIWRSLMTSVMTLSVDGWGQKPNKYQKFMQIETGDRLNYMISLKTSCPNDVHKAQSQKGR